MTQIKNKSIRGAFALSLFTLAAFYISLATAGARDLLKTVPENMDVVFGIEDIKQLSEKLKISPTGEIFTNETLVEFTTPMRESMLEGIGKKWGGEYTGDEILESIETLFDGQLVFMLEGLEETGPSQFAVVAQFSGDEEDVRKIISPISDEQQQSDDTSVETYTEEVAGITLHIEEVSRDGVILRKNGWALYEDVFILAHPYELLKEMAIRQAEEEPVDSIIDAPHAADAWAELKGSDIFLYADLGKLATAWEEMMLADEGEQSDPMLNLELMFEKLKLDNLGAFTMGLSLGTDEDVLSTAIYFKERAGVVELLAYEKGDLPRPEFVEADSLNSSVSRFNIARAYKMLRNTLGASPMGEAMLNNSFQMLESQVGFNVEEALIDSLGTIFITYMDFRPGPIPEEMTTRPVDQLFMLGLKDAKRFERVLESIISMYNLGAHLETREFLGYEYRVQAESLAPIDPDQRVGYVITDQYLIINMGSTQLLERVLAGKAEAQLWEDPKISKLVNRLPPNPSELNYTNLGALLVSMIKDIAQTAALYTDSEEGPEWNLELLEQDLELPIASLAAIYVTEQGLRSETHIIRHKENEE